MSLTLKTKLFKKIHLIYFYFIFQKFGSSGLTTDHHHVPPSGTYPHSSLLPCPGSERHDALEGGEIDPESQPKSSQYLNPNCVLLSYFSGDTSTVVDEHFTRALSQPSSFNLDRNFSSSSSFSIKSKAGKYSFQIIIKYLYILKSISVKLNLYIWFCPLLYFCLQKQFYKILNFSINLRDEEKIDFFFK